LIELSRNFFRSTSRNDYSSDATQQNARIPANNFDKAIKLTGIALTKYDGTSKGGIIFNLKHNLKLPVKLLGVGEGIEDLMPFKAVPFVKAFFEE
jgi:fused signal recognition particle receptor